MNYTSERVSPEQYRNNLQEYLIYLMHERTYLYVLPSIKNKRVLDFGCGEGYGSQILSSDAQHVTAIDVSSETIQKAQQKYAAQHIHFQATEPVENAPLPFHDNSFDVVLSFQVIEHVKDVDTYLNEIMRVLAPGGYFFLSTPNAKSRLLPFQNPWNKFHRREYTADSLTTTLHQKFRNTKLLGLSFSEPWVHVENRRVSFNKWLLWPVTNKLIPDALRRYLLHKIWNAAALLKTKKIIKDSKNDFPDITDAIVTDKGLPKCPSLLAICTNAKNG